jgi:hypothetical protein
MRAFARQTALLGIPRGRHYEMMGERVIVPLESCCFLIELRNQVRLTVK